VIQRVIERGREKERKSNMREERRKDTKSKREYEEY
jgi:hypothetical protein